MKKSVFLIIFLLFSLYSCTNLYVAREGIIIEKRYTPALTYGKYGPPYDEYMFKLKLKEYNKTQKVYVSKKIYNKFDVGDSYPTEK